MQFYVVLGLLALSGQAFSQECKTELLEKTDFQGDDIIKVMSPDAEHCQLACTQHPTCRFFTFNTGNLNCFLKDSSSGQPSKRVIQSMATSGFALKGCDPSLQCKTELLEKTDFQGDDIIKVMSPDAEHCQLACTQHPTCRFFTFNTGNLNCFLKDSSSGQPSKRVIQSMATSGFALKGCDPSLQCKTELLEKTDFQGDDIIKVMSPDAEHCQLACTQHPTCRFFTFNTGNFKCFLKDSLSGQPSKSVILSKAISGFALKGCDPSIQTCQRLLHKVYPNVDFLGDDFLSLFTDSHEECQRACTNQPGCQAFTFLTENFTPEQYRYKCHLKFLWTVPRPLKVRNLPGASSGFSKNLDPLLLGSKEACKSTIFNDINVRGEDLENVPAVSAEHCQHLCTSHPLCSYFSFHKIRQTCFLKNNRDMMRFVAEKNMFTGMPTRHCAPSSDWVFADYDGVDFLGSDKKFVLLDDKESCRQACNEDPACQFYTYLSSSFNDPVHRRRCYLKRIITLPLSPKVGSLPNVVSGFSLNCGLL
ncbi:coagulation factor XI-like isoform X3 [Osmerus eperlanus]|uniref:coagulation factor XI-like isoform X3 n=1 Tax=Osmerus eperlanus TaxID=29151 RepID=UPI002E161D0F